MSETDVTYGEKCDHAPCHCVTNAHSATTRGKEVYCSPGCAKGEGCGHESCNCAAHTEAT